MYHCCIVKLIHKQTKQQFRIVNQGEFQQIKAIGFIKNTLQSVRDNYDKKLENYFVEVMYATEEDGKELYEHFKN